MAVNLVPFLMVLQPRPFCKKNLYYKCLFSTDRVKESIDVYDYICHQFLQYFILYQLWIVDLKHVLGIHENFSLTIGILGAI